MLLYLIHISVQKAISVDSCGSILENAAVCVADFEALGYYLASPALDISSCSRLDHVDMPAQSDLDIEINMESEAGLQKAFVHPPTTRANSSSFTSSLIFNDGLAQELSELKPTQLFNLVIELSGSPLVPLLVPIPGFR